MKWIETQLGVDTVRHGAVADPLSSIGRHELDVVGPFGSEEIKELLQRFAVVALSCPHETAGVVIDHDHQILVTAPIRDLIDADADQRIERIARGPAVSHHPRSNRTNGAPRDTHQLHHRSLGGVRHQPRDLVIELSGVTGTVTRPRHRSNRHRMYPTRNPRRCCFDEHPRRASIKRPPAAASVTTVIQPRHRTALTAPRTPSRVEPHRHHDHIAAVHNLTIDTGDHPTITYPGHPSPYPV